VRGPARRLAFGKDEAAVSPGFEIVGVEDGKASSASFEVATR
jgi:hypothetical protein